MNAASVGAKTRWPAVIMAALLAAVGCTSGADVIATRTVAPTYPPIPLSAGLEADVVVVATIDEGGKVTAASVVKGHPFLDRAAAAAARQWSFNTGRGAREARLTFSFRLDKDAAGSFERWSAFVPPFHVDVFAALPPPSVNYRSGQGEG